MTERNGRMKGKPSPLIRLEQAAQSIPTWLASAVAVVFLAVLAL